MMRRMDRRHFLAALAVSPIAARAAAQGFTDDSWTDAARSRDVPLRLRWPTGSGACALIVHSHGLGGNREGGDAWGRAWQDAGFAVLHVQHPGSDSEVLRSGVRALRSAASAEQLLARVADMRFVLDEIERRARDAGSPFARVRLDAIGASGHSFGAQTVQALVGQRFAVRAALAEPRFKAFIAFSPSLRRRDDTTAQEQFGTVTRPFLAVTGSDDGEVLGNGATPESRAQVYDGLPPGRRALLWLDGADHMTFAGNAQRRIDGRGPFRRAPAVAANEPRHHTLVARTTTLWWRAQLLNDAQSQQALREKIGAELGPNDRWRFG